MGAWGFGSFENDDALDWIAKLEESKDLSVITGALNVVLDSPDDYHEAPDCVAALAAAETVAALTGNPVSSLPNEIAQWIDGYSRQGMDSNLVSMARQVVDTILFNSELQTLWKESDMYDEWRSVITDLRSRLILKL